MRLLEFISVDSLKYEEAKQALVEPALDQNVYYTQEAVDYIIEVTGGYPYFLQEYV